MPHQDKDAERQGKQLVSACLSIDFMKKRRRLAAPTFP
ncbi:hypothetical protein [Azospirillum argentinense]